MGLERTSTTVLQYSSGGPDRPIDLRSCLERVTGIEPAWPAWPAGRVRGGSVPERVLDEPAEARGAKVAIVPGDGSRTFANVHRGEISMAEG